LVSAIGDTMGDAKIAPDQLLVVARALEITSKQNR